jgi:signal peptidase I
VTGIPAESGPGSLHPPPTEAATPDSGAPAGAAPDGDVERSPVLEIGRELGVLLVTAIIIAVVVKSFIAQAFYIPSGSMLPQLQINDRVVVSKLAYHLHNPHRGDIVVFDAPGGGPKDTSPLPERVVRDIVQSIGLSAPSTDEYIKRVIAVAGERVEAHGGKVFVDGRELVEPYLPAGVVTSDFTAVIVPPGTLWVMGDNRGNSSDSRVFGPVPRSTVVGRAFVRVWPLAHSSFL